MKGLAYRLRGARELISQLWRYGLVGLSMNGLGYSVYVAVTALGMKPKVAMTLLYVVGAIVSFLLNRRVTFTHRGGIATAGLRYAGVFFVGYLLNFGILIVAVDRWGLPHQAVQAGAVFIVAVFLFSAMKFFVFQKDIDQRSVL